MSPITNMRELSIGQLSAVAHVPVETIRYWERLGLVPSPPRSGRGHRLYGNDHVCRLVFVRRARQLGFGLRDLRSLLGFAAAPQTSCPDVRQLAERHLQHVRAELAALTAIEAALAQAVSCCSVDPIGTCPVLDLLDGATIETRDVDRSIQHGHHR